MGSKSEAFIRCEIDRHLGMSPCVCGDIHTWHPACYKGKTPRQLENARKRVYAYLLGHLKLRLKP